LVEAVFPSKEESIFKSRSLYRVSVSPLAVVIRWGLWTFDLAVTQQIQQTVGESTVGLFNGIQVLLLPDE
jgi:hypothetical protein